MRRGLFAAAWAAVAAMVFRQTTETVEAGVDGDVVLGAMNTTTTGTNVINTTAGSFALAGNCTNGAGVGLIANGGRFGVSATGIQQQSGLPAAGVFGTTSDGASYGIWGINAGPAGVSVRGDAFNGAAIGVEGVSSGVGAIGVSGTIPTASTATGIGMYGLNLSSFAGSGPGAGGFGVYGLSALGHGLVGATATAGGAAVVGATNGVAGAFAAAFFGPVIVGGAFTVVGGPKSAAVPLPDGTHRRLYCLESPESWFEDFGTGQLEDGCASVAIEATFAALVHLDEYHVFLTSYEHPNDLFVTRQTSAGFTVESRNAASHDRFSWRIVAKRKDITAPRFEPVTVPPEPVLPPIPARAAR
jgi:hypothetical protein